MTDRERLCAVTVGCPACGTRPALRLSEWLAERVGEEERARRLATYKCHRRGCGMIYDIAAGALRG